MPLCEQCLSISNKTITTGRNTIFHHDAVSLAKAVEEKCFACLRIWGSLSGEQQAIARHADFEGLDCVLCFDVGWTRGVDGPLLADVTFEHGEDLYCDDYNDVGGWKGPAGHFAVLNPHGMNLDDRRRQGAGGVVKLV